MDGLFLMNAGNTILIFVLVVLVYVTAVILTKRLKDGSKPKHYAEKVRYMFEWSGVERVWITLYLDLCITAFL